MTSHISECDCFDQDGHTADCAFCICEQLQAYGERIKRGFMDVPLIWSDGFANGAQAARDAVAAVPPIDQWVDDNGLVSLVYDKAEALAAIDALREERK